MQTARHETENCVRIDPRSMFRQNYNDHELLWVLIFGVMVAGKRSDVTLEKLYDLLEFCHPLISPTLTVYELRDNPDWLYKVKTGKYQLMTRFFDDLLQQMLKRPDFLRTCSLKELEALTAVGPKTARFFLSNTRRTDKNKYAVLDVHILRWLRTNGWPAAPAQTPSSPHTYQIWEDAFLSAASAKGLPPGKLDQEIWNGAGTIKPQPIM